MSEEKGIDYPRLKQLTRGSTVAEVTAILISNKLTPQFGKGGKPFLLPVEYTAQTDKPQKANVEV